MTLLAVNEPFDPAVLGADLAVVRGIVGSFFSQVEADDWDRPTESRASGWTLKQAFCHVVAVAELIDEALEYVVGGVTDRYQSAPIETRYELAEFNQGHIAQREHLPPEDLGQSFLERLICTEKRVADLSEAELNQPVPLNVYNRPLSVGELIGNQLVHPTLVHGAQLANGIGVEPLWRHFPAGLMNRQLTRFLHIFSHAYWPERGGDLRAVINIKIRGEGGGMWHVGLDEVGGTVGRGGVKRPTTTLYFASPDAFCSAFTLQLKPLKGVLSGKMFAWGNLPLAFRLNYLFRPT